MLHVIIVLVGILIYLQFFRNKKRPNLPPGPKPLPIIGNIRDLPPKGVPEFRHWLKLKDTYGPVSSITVLGQSLILIHDRQAAHELFEKSSMKTSGRPILNFGGRMCGYERLVSLQQYDDTFKRHRKMIHRQLGTRAVAAKFQKVQDVESHRFLLRVLDNPGNLMDHIKKEAGAIILKMTYGYSVEPQKSDPLVLLIERMMHNASIVFVPMAFLVDILPSLEYLPEFLPGMSFKGLARKWKNVLDMTIEVPYAFVRQQMAKGIQRESYVSSVLGQDKLNDKLDETEETGIKHTAAMMYAGGADTTVSTIQSFILAMTVHPEVLKKAQAEIDNVIGADRLPQFEDRQNLPYINGLVKESLRWMPVAPMGIAHVADDDINYGNLCIPKGSYILPNVWWFLHDPETYPNPDHFDPERYLEPRNEPDPDSNAFGYGRRICPGRFLADESLFITISRLVAVFDIEKDVDEQGNTIEPKVEATASGVVSRPINYPYKIKPRNAKCVELIRSVESEHPWEDGDASLLPQGMAMV
ncbi:O-methylsterigmatocystin oxidoreductase [Fusarium austroafricanum]|uniref:O-methylsterigmatocystin oxidoreductase n=1 Tax=Fusarium austroafricanum TaxID=2364996 RepID=A0A8H4KE84_9HYPO|nr:O-methylsterigmatocystin oxidoreductase [Fusarium austroafricanum]